MEVEWRGEGDGREGRGGRGRQEGRRGGRRNIKGGFDATPNTSRRLKGTSSEAAAVIIDRGLV